MGILQTNWSVIFKESELRELINGFKNERTIQQQLNTKHDSHGSSLTRQES